VSKPFNSLLKYIRIYNFRNIAQLINTFMTGFLIAVAPSTEPWMLNGLNLKLWNPELISDRIAFVSLPYVLFKPLLSVDVLRHENYDLLTKYGGKPVSTPDKGQYFLFFNAR
jgi:hypothetical protein